MVVSDIDRTAVLRAIEEFDRLGQDAFLQQHGFGRSRSYFLRHGGKLYDSKAIIGVAHGYSGDDRRPLLATPFSGGKATVAQTLRGLGFEVQVSAALPAGFAANNISAEGYAYWWSIISRPTPTRLAVAISGHRPSGATGGATSSMKI